MSHIWMTDDKAQLNTIDRLMCMHMWHIACTCWLDACICATWLMRMFDMSPANGWHDACVCETWHSLVYSTWYVRAPLMCATWLVPVCSMTQSSILIRLQTPIWWFTTLFHLWWDNPPSSSSISRIWGISKVRHGRKIPTACAGLALIPTEKVSCEACLLQYRKVCVQVCCSVCVKVCCSCLQCVQVPCS